MTTIADREKFEGVFLILLALVITALFLGMIRGFLQALLLAAVFSGMLYPLYRRLARRLGGRNSTAAVLTVLLFVVVLVVPISMFLGLVVSQAVDVSASVTPWIERELHQPQQLDRWLGRLPFWETIQPYQDYIAAKLAEFAGHLGTFLVSILAAASRGTANFFFDLFVMLYAMFFFLRRGKEYLARLLYYVPLEADAENRLVAKFVSVTRATIKGTLVIGVLQGGFAGMAFWIAGIKGWAFWTVIMMVLSIVPGVGTALVWIPAVVYLLAAGSTGAAIALGVWCALVVGTIDNVLRPRLVGRDTQMSDLLVLLGTLGGIVFFGASGFIIGPIIAGLWVTVWEIYGEVFADYLPEAKVEASMETIAEMPGVAGLVLRNGPGTEPPGAGEDEPPDGEGSVPS